MGIFEPIAALGEIWVFVINMACTILGGIIGTAIIIKITRRILKKSDHVDDAIVTFVINAIKVACIIIIIALGLQLLGVKPPTIVTVLGAAGAAIALALRDSLANIVGGFMIIVTHPFVKGDLISVGDDRGKVVEIDLFLTTLRTLDYKTITIPNGKINTSVIYNETREVIRRVDLTFNVSYDSDVEKVKEIIRNVCDANDMILKDPEARVVFMGHNESGVAIDCLAYCKTEDRYDVEYYIRETVKIAFEEADIQVAYPRVDVRTKK